MTYNQSLKKNTARLALWTFLWMVSLAIVSFGSIWIWDENTTISLIFIIINILMGIGMIMANRRYLKSLDELQRQMALETMGITLGVALVGGLAFSMLDITNVIPFDAEISYLVLLLGITYIVTTVINHKRYS